MQTRRRPVLLVVAFALAAGPALAQRTDNRRQQPQQQGPQRSPQEQQDIDTLFKLVDAVSGGAMAAPTDIPISWDSNHFIKGQGGETYVPFTLTIDRSKFPSPSAALYLRVVDKKAPAASTLVVLPTTQNPGGPAMPTFTLSRIYFFDLPEDGKASRAIMLKGGEYEVFVAVKEKTPPPPPPQGNQRNQRNAPPPPAPAPAPAAVGLLRRDLAVPDFNTAELTTSSLLLVETVEPLTSQVTPEQQEANPYSFGPMRLVPAPEGKFKKSGEFQVVFWVYGAKEAGGGKPDVVVDYNFYQRLADKEQYFNKTQPQPINAENLPPDFNLASGLPLPGQLVVPLTRFPAGDYRLEVKVTDKAAAGAMVTRSVNFTVLPL